MWAQHGPYFSLFTNPSDGVSGGLPSDHKSYYSFDHGTAHFVSVDSDSLGLEDDPGLYEWLEADLARARRLPYDWIVVFQHHPPFSKVSHAPKHPRVRAYTHTRIHARARAGTDRVAPQRSLLCGVLNSTSSPHPLTNYLTKPSTGKPRFRFRVRAVQAAHQPRASLRALRRRPRARRALALVREEPPCVIRRARGLPRHRALGRGRGSRRQQSTRRDARQGAVRFGIRHGVRGDRLSHADVGRILEPPLDGCEPGRPRQRAVGDRTEPPHHHARGGQFPRKEQPSARQGHAD